MITVLYTMDLEPITVIDIPIDVKEEIEKRGLGKVPVISADEEPKYMYLHPVRFSTPQGVVVIFTTKEEELALTVKPEWLPGQQAMIQNMRTIIHQQQQTLKKLTKRGGDTHE